MASKKNIALAQEALKHADSLKFNFGDSAQKTIELLVKLALALQGS
jgi:hypothetical protein